MYKELYQQQNSLSTATAEEHDSFVFFVKHGATLSPDLTCS